MVYRFLTVAALAAVLFNFWPLRKGLRENEIYTQKGRASAGNGCGGGGLIGLQFAESFSFLVGCALLCIGWAVYWLIGGFFDVD